MDTNTRLQGSRPIRMLPQAIAIIFWIVEIFLTIDGSSFMLSFAWPIPYKDAFYEDFSIFYLVYSVILLFIFILSFIKPRLAAIPIPLILIFEVYALISPILYKALYYSVQHANRYALSIFDLTSTTFYIHTLKSFILMAIAIMLFVATLARKRKTVIILFAIAVVLTAVTIVPAILEMNDLYASGIIELSQYQKLGKSIAVGIFRVIPLLPLFFIDINAKEKKLKA